MPSNYRITYDNTKLKTIIRKLGGNTRDAVRTVAFAVERGAKIWSPVDTGAHRASIMVVMGKEGRSMPDVPGTPVRVSLPQPRNDTTAHVGATVEYSMGLELGTAKRAATPFLLPAVREAEKLQPDAYKKVVTGG